MKLGTGLNLRAAFKGERISLKVSAKQHLLVAEYQSHIVHEKSQFGW